MKIFYSFKIFLFSFRVLSILNDALTTGFSCTLHFSLVTYESLASGHVQKENASGKRAERALSTRITHFTFRGKVKPTLFSTISFSLIHKNNNNRLHSLKVVRLCKKKRKTLTINSLSLRFCFSSITNFSLRRLRSALVAFESLVCYLKAFNVQLCDLSRKHTGSR